MPDRHHRNASRKGRNAGRGEGPAEGYQPSTCIAVGALVTYAATAEDERLDEDPKAHVEEARVHPRVGPQGRSPRRLCFRCIASMR